GRDIGRAAHHADRSLPAVLVDEAEGHVASAAKKAVAFFRVSRSICRRLFSARRRRTSSSRGERVLRPGKACPSAWSFCFQTCSKFSERPGLRAASVTERPSMVSSLTAASLKSRV